MSNVIEFPSDLVSFYYTRGDKDKAVKQAFAELGKEPAAKHFAMAGHPSVSSFHDIRRIAMRAS